MKLDSNDFLSDFNEYELSVLDKIIQSTIEEFLATGTKNTLKTYLKGDLSLKNLIKRGIIPPRSSYLDIERVGSKANNELIELMKRVNFALHCVRQPETKNWNAEVVRKIIVQDKIETDKEFAQSRYALEIYKKLDYDKKQTINFYIELIYKQLSARSINALNALLKEDITIDNLIGTKVIFRDYNLLDIPNIGEKSANELENFFLHIMHYMCSIAMISEPYKVLQAKNKNILLNRFPNNKDCHLKIDYSKCFVLQIIQEALKLEMLFDRQETYIFTRTHAMYQRSKLYELSEIATELNLSRERIRQIRNEFTSKHQESLQFLKLISDPGINRAEEAKKRDYLSIKELPQLLKEENYPFTPNYIIYLLSFYFEPFELLGNVSDSLRKETNNKNRHSWNNLYLVKKTISKAIDYKRLIDELSLQLNRDIDEGYTVCYQRLIRKFTLSEEQYNSHKKSIDALLFLLFEEELKLGPVVEGKILIKKNTPYTLRFVVPKVIEKIGRPITLKELHIKIKREYPQVSCHPNSIRSACIANPEIITFGRSSTYGLKVWESDEKQNIQGGTIRELVFDFLDEIDRPAHLYEIYLHIKRYRKSTYPRSISDNLRAQRDSMFNFYNQNYIGLKDRNYQKSKVTNLPRFLGKDILKLVRENPKAKLEDIKRSLSHQNKISEREIAYILLYLQEQEYLIINEDKVTLL